MSRQPFPTLKDAVKQFLSRHEDRITGVLSGFDRLVFRGTLRHISYTDGMGKYLSYQKILLKEFAEFALQRTSELKQALYQQAERLERPVVYLESSRKNKEAIAREIAQQDNVRSGLIAVLSCVEPCITFSIRRNRQKKRLELVQSLRKCLNFYHYCMDPILVSCMPYPKLVSTQCSGLRPTAVNGSPLRWIRLAFNIGARENCFTWVEDAHAAQQLLDEQLKTNWPHILNRPESIRQSIARQIYSRRVASTTTGVSTAANGPPTSRFVTALASRDLSRSCTSCDHKLSSPDVMRFSGKRIRTDFSGEVVSRFRDRPEGLRIKHALDLNFRQTLRQTRFRAPCGDNHPACRGYALLPAKGRRPQRPSRVASRSVVASQTCIVVPSSPRTPMSATSTLSPLVIPQPHSVDSSLASAKKLNGMAPPSELFALGTLWTARLLAAISRGEFHLRGFRNRELRALLFPKTSDDPLETGG